MKNKIAWLGVVLSILIAVPVAVGQGYGSISSTFSRITFQNPSDATVITMQEGGKICLNPACSAFFQDPISNAPLIQATSWLVSGPMTSLSGSGTNGFACLTNGCRLDLGAGANDYVASDGSSVYTGAGLNVNGSLTIQNSGNIYHSVIQGTPTGGTGITSVSPANITRFYSKVTYAYTAVTAAATSQDLTVWTFPARTIVHRVIADVTAGFDDGAGPMSASTISCGSSAGGTQHLLANSAFTANTLGDATAELGASAAAVAGHNYWTVGGILSCRFTSTGANLSTMTAGSVTFYIEGVVYQ